MLLLMFKNLFYLSAIKTSVETIQNKIPAQLAPREKQVFGIHPLVISFRDIFLSKALLQYVGSWLWKYLPYLEQSIFTLTAIFEL